MCGIYINKMLEMIETFVMWLPVILIILYLIYDYNAYFEDIRDWVSEDWYVIVPLLLVATIYTVSILGG